MKNNNVDDYVVGDESISAVISEVLAAEKTAAATVEEADKAARDLAEMADNYYAEAKEKMNDRVKAYKKTLDADAKARAAKKRGELEKDAEVVSASIKVDTKKKADVVAEKLFKKLISE